MSENNAILIVKLCEDADGKPYTVVSYDGKRWGTVQEWCRKHGFDFRKVGPDGESTLIFMTADELRNLKA